MTRAGSPTSVSGTAASVSIVSAIFFVAARSISRALLSVMRCRSEKSTDSSSSLPASILEKSRMSLSRSSKNSALVWAISRCWRVFPLSAGSRKASFCIPMTAESGVRISWLTMARNSLFMRLALSVASLAEMVSANPVHTSCSSFLRAVMSSMTQRQEFSEPAVQMRETLTRSHISAPSSFSNSASTNSWLSSVGSPQTDSM